MRIGLVPVVGLLALGACVTHLSPPARPTPPPVTTVSAECQCKDIWEQELRRAIDPPALVACVGQFQAGVTGEAIRAGVKASPEWAEAHKPAPPVAAAPRIHADGKIFRTASGQPWRYKGVSAFKLLAKHAAGENLQPFLDAYKGFNTLRVWAYVQGAAWHGRDWPTPPTVEQTQAFLSYVGARGWTVELTLLTDDHADRLAWAKTFVPQLTAGGCPQNLLLEAGNEPTTNKAIDTAALRSVLDASGCPYASGNYEESEKAFGSYLVHHSSRDDEWPRRAHDCLEFWHGGGPHTSTDPAHRVPCVLDEPGKPQDAPAATAEIDWRAYFGTAALLGAGATFHCETCKYGDLPTREEQILAKAALEGLDAFPADAPLGPYSRPDDASLRTYIVGSSMVRIRPTTDSYGSGWARIGPSPILWRR